MMRKIAIAIASLHKLTGIPILGEIYQVLYKSIQEKEAYERKLKGKKEQMEQVKRDIEDANPFKKSS